MRPQKQKQKNDVCFKNNFLKRRKFLKKQFWSEFVTGKFTTVHYRYFPEIPSFG